MENNIDCETDKVKEPYFSKVIELSTAHLTMRTLERIKSDFWRFNLFVYPHRDGAFVLVDDEIDMDDLSNDLRKCIKYAKQFDCEWIYFNCNAKVLSSLKSYDERTDEIPLVWKYVLNAIGVAGKNPNLPFWASGDKVFCHKKEMAEAVADFFEEMGLVIEIGYHDWDLCEHDQDDSDEDAYGWWITAFR